MPRLPLTGAALALAALIQTSPAAAQTYPSRQITIMPLLAAGTGLDTVVRLYSEHLTQTLGRTVVIENRPGNAGLAGVAALKAAPADGHTLMVATSSVMAIRPSLLKDRPYDPIKDFVPLALYVKSPFILVVNPKLPVRSVPDLIKYIKERPGKISYSSPGVGGAPHLSIEYMKQRFGLDIAHVPYKISPQSIADVTAGHIDLAFAEAGVSLPLIRADKLRALAVSSATRLPSIPDIATFAEAASAPDFEAVSWHMLLAPAGTPQDIVERLHAEMKRIMAIPEVNKKVASVGLIPFETPSIDGMRDYIRSEGEKWGGLVKSLGLAGTM